MPSNYNTTYKPDQVTKQYDLGYWGGEITRKWMHFPQQTTPPKAKARVKAKHHKSLRKSRG